MKTTLESTLRRVGLLRCLNILAGLWLFISAFLFPHSFDEAMSVWILGILISACAAASIFALELRYLDAIFGALLGVSALVLSAAPAITRINETCVALAVVSLAFLLGRPRGHHHFHLRAGR